MPRRCFDLQQRLWLQYNLMRLGNERAGGKHPSRGRTRRADFPHRAPQMTFAKSATRRRTGRSDKHECNRKRHPLNRADQSGKKSLSQPQPSGLTARALRKSLLVAERALLDEICETIPSIRPAAALMPPPGFRKALPAAKRRASSARKPSVGRHQVSILDVEWWLLVFRSMRLSPAETAAFGVWAATPSGLRS